MGLAGSVIVHSLEHLQQPQAHSRQNAMQKVQISTLTSQQMDASLNSLTKMTIVSQLTIKN